MDPEIAPSTAPTTSAASEPASAPEPASPSGEESVSTAVTAVDDYAELAKIAKAAAAQFREDNPKPEAGEEESEAPAAPEAKAAGEAAAEPDEGPLAKLLKSREKAQAQRNEADEYVARMRGEAESVASTIIREAQERARRIEQETEARIRARLDEQLSPEALLAKQADAADPQVQLRRWMESELKKRDEELAKRDAALKQIADAQEEQRSAGQQIRVKQAEQAFVASAKKDSHPALLALYTPGEILRQGHALLAEAREVDRNFACTDAELLQVLEGRAKSRLLENREALNSALQQVAATQGKASPGQKAPAPRTLSAIASSERRATPKPSSEMNETEMEKAMRAAARAAIRK